MDPEPARTYRGGCTDRTALRTVFLAKPNFFAIALIDIRSARYNRRISAQSSTVITLPIPHPGSGGVNIHPSAGGQFSRVADKALRPRRVTLTARLWSCRTWRSGLLASRMP
jgi:hypothetical protein